MIYLNGEFVSARAFRIDSGDRGFLLGDGLFETIRVYDGRIFCLQDHLDRMIIGAGILQIPVPLTVIELATILSNLLEINGLSQSDAILRITLTRGSGLRGLLPSPNIKPSVMITATHLPVKPAQAPITLRISQITRRNEHSPLSNIKSLCYLDNVLAKMEAVENHADDAILLNTSGHVTSVSAANIFIITHNNGVVTPPIDEGVLPGITRKIVLEICQEKNISFSEQRISPNELALAREMFITNSIIQIQPVASVDNQIINNGIMGQLTMTLCNYFHSKTIL